MAKKRRHPRYSVKDMAIHANTIFNTEGAILDIGACGASIRGQKRLNIGGEYTFRFKHKDNVISIQGVIVWEKLTDSRKNAKGEIIPIYTAGIEFLEGLTDGALRLRAFLADTVKELRERRLNGIRVKIYGLEDVLITSLEMCRLRDISLGGMRIETEQDIPVETPFFLDLILKEQEEPIHCRGRVAFSLQIPEREPKQYSVGVEFIDMVNTEKSRLKEFMDTLPSNDEEA